MTFGPDLTACAALVQKADPERFLAAMASPVAARQVLFPLYALNVEVSRAPWVTAEPMIAEMRLQWWRDALAEIAATGTVRRHEVVTPLARVLTAETARDLDEFVAVRRWDIYKDAFEDMAHFTRYIDQSAGSLMWAAARSLGEADETVVRHHAFAAGLASWLRAVPDLKSRGRKPLLDDGHDGLRALAQMGLDRLKIARAERSGVSRSAAPALLSGWQARTILQQVVADPGRVNKGNLKHGELAGRAMLMARAAVARW